jgi:hypothetical protein
MRAAAERCVRLSRWSASELAREAVTREIVEQISGVSPPWASTLVVGDREAFPLGPRRGRDAGHLQSAPGRMDCHSTVVSQRFRGG